MPRLAANERWTLRRGQDAGRCSPMAVMNCSSPDARSSRARVTMPRMTAELVLSALYESDDTRGDVTALAVTDR